MPRKLTSSLIATLAALIATAAVAGVRWEVRPDGTRHMVNDPPPTRRPPPARAEPAVPPSRVAALVEENASRRGLDPRLIDAVIRAESSYDPAARSPKGAMGLMQLMPGTARELGVADPWDPAQNVHGGTSYLRRMLDRFDGRLDLALAGYNAGPEAVERHRGVPPYPETRRYVERVLRLYGGESEVERWRAVRPGRPVFLTRRPGEGLVLTTTPPAREAGDAR